ncbi:hypothetical protein B484DRAFT_186939, partial [Ochromonadaceae sp. CCMP2298]
MSRALLKPLRKAPVEDRTELIDVLYSVRTGGTTWGQVQQVHPANFVQEAQKQYRQLRWDNDGFTPVFAAQDDLRILREACVHVGGRYTGTPHSHRELRDAVYDSCRRGVRADDIYESLMCNKASFGRLQEQVHDMLFPPDPEAIGPVRRSWPKVQGFFGLRDGDPEYALNQARLRAMCDRDLVFRPQGGQLGERPGRRRSVLPSLP